jgi:hypothetical protein
MSVPEPATSGLWSNVPLSDMSAFINGTALGLVCTVPPSTSDNAWPYGGGGVNAALGGASSGTTTSTGSARPSGTSGSTPSGSASSETKSSGASAGYTSGHASLLFGVIVTLGAVLGASLV